jgi:hypothetical protein
MAETLEKCRVFRDMYRSLAERFAEAPATNYIDNQMPLSVLSAHYAQHEDGKNGHLKSL